MIRILLIIVVLSITGCSTYSTVKTEPRKINNITVTPTQQWNKVPSYEAFGGAETWTVDGTSLDTISFFAGIEEGKPIIKSRKKEEFPVFKADMLPNELVELVESSLAKFYGARVTKSGTLQPIPISGEQGFLYEFEFITPDDLTRRGMVAGLVRNKLLNMVFFQAARLYYFEHHVNNVKGIIDTLRVNE